MRLGAALLNRVTAVKLHGSSSRFIVVSGRRGDGVLGPFLEFFGYTAGAPSPYAARAPVT